MNFAPMRNYKVDVGERTHTQCVNPEKMRLQLKENKAWKTDTGEKPERVFVVGDIPGRGFLSTHSCISFDCLFIEHPVHTRGRPLTHAGISLD